MSMMFKNKGNWLMLLVLVICNSNTHAQTLPVGTPILEDYYRRMQLLGKTDSNISFTIRPLTSEALKIQDVFNPDTTDSGAVRQSHHRTFARGKGKFQLLPITLQTQYNSKRPYGWNDGPRIPARGFQTMFNAGAYADYGPFSVQLSPEIVFAENKGFKTIEDANRSFDIGGYDLPERFGEKQILKFFPGQSNLRLNLSSVSIGISSENLWWGPGRFNSLLMSNNSTGFYHITLNTIKPLSTPLGRVEGQIVAGRLEGSGFTNKKNDWRYLSGLIFTYQPKWVPGLYLGVTRAFQMYSHEMGKGLSYYFPLLQAFEKGKTNEDAFNRDQITSAFCRWLWTDAMTEFYLEYGRNDHSANLRDLVVEPEHSRAYILGFQKIFKLNGVSNQSYIQLGAELTHLQQSPSWFLRNAGPWYAHAGVTHGYTHEGQALGAGISPGSNLQTLEINWLQDLGRIGLEFERYVHDPETYILKNLATKSGPWIDYCTAMQIRKAYKKVLVEGKVKAINSSNYQWRTGNAEMINLQLQLGVSYRLSSAKKGT